MVVPTLIAATQMNGSIVGAIVLLVAGVALLQYMRGHSADRQRGLPWVALIAGPVFAGLYLWIDYYWIKSRDYRTWDDTIQSVVPVMIVGTFGGIVGAIALGLGSRLMSQRSR